MTWARSSVPARCIEGNGVTHFAYTARKGASTRSPPGEPRAADRTKDSMDVYPTLTYRDAKTAV